MRKRYILFAVIVAVSGLAFWRFRKLPLSNVLPIDTASISEVSAGVVVMNLEEASSYLLDDAEMDDPAVREILNILDTSEYRPDYRSLLPWGVRSLSADRNYDGRSVQVSFSDGSRGGQLQFMTSSLMSVIATDSAKMQVYHPVSKNTFQALVEYIQVNGVKQ